MSTMIVQNWYWAIATMPDKVYSSARNIYVDPADADYQQWQDWFGAVAGDIGTEAEVWHYMQNLLPAWLFDGTTFVQPAEGEYTKEQLHAYQAFVRYNTEQGGMTLSSGMPIRTDDRAQAKINGVSLRASNDNTFTTKWAASDGSFYNMNAAAILSMSNELQTFIDSCFETSATVASGIDGGTITSLAQIDNAFASVTTRALRKSA